MVVVNFTIW